MSLAGGLGTRLRPCSAVFPKLLVPIGDGPTLDIGISQLSLSEGFDKHFLVINGDGLTILDYRVGDQAVEVAMGVYCFAPPAVGGESMNARRSAARLDLGRSSIPA